MKKVFLLLAILTMLFTSCANKKTIKGITYRPYGLLNESTCKNDSIEYEISGCACVSGVVFFEFIIPPIYTFGFNLWEPVGLKKDYVDSKIKGVIK